MNSADIILAMRAANDPERLHQLRRRQFERTVLTLVVLLAGSLLVLFATCA